MNKIWKSKHTISTLSNFHAQDLPKPFRNIDYYVKVIRNLFVNKNSEELVKIELEYDVSEYCYMSIKVYAPTSKGIFIDDLVDVKQFINWYSKSFEPIVYKQEVNEKIIYTSNESCMYHNIIISLNQYDNYICVIRKNEINKEKR